MLDRSDHGNPASGTSLRHHGLIGDRSTGALVAADATIDWYCPKRFDAPAAFFSLLDERHGGRVSIAPGPVPGKTVEQAYDTTGAPVLRTRLSGRESLIDVHDVLDSGRIVRVITALRGTAEIQLTVVPGDRFGSPRKVHRWSNGVAFGALVVRGPSDMTRLEPGQQLVVTIDPADETGVVHSGPSNNELTVGEARMLMERSARHWKSDLDEVAYDGAFAPSVRAAVRALRLCTDATTGAVVGAITTSLPARLGNERNTDERYAWLRDNAAAVWLWERVDRPDWADETRAWLTERAGEELPLPPCMRVDGERLGSEEEISLPGWSDASPVRTSNRAADGLDLSGIAMLSMVLDARRSWPKLERLGDWLTEHGTRPDHGRWDSRARPVEWVASRLVVATALRALVATSRSRNPLEPELRGWSDAVADADAWLGTEARFGVPPRAGWRRLPTDDSSDAAALPWAANRPTLSTDGPGDPETRLDVTIDQMLAQLEEGPFLHRHLPHVDDGFPPGQGPDLAASFWMVSALAAAGRWEAAHDRMEALISWIGPLGIVPAHADPFTGDFRGNLPSSAAAIALISAALDLRAGPR